MVGRLRPGSVNRGYRLGQIASASLLSLSHGTNDAQKTMGIITLALDRARRRSSGPSPDPPFWVIVSAATAIALGTYTGGWRIIRTMGSKIYKMDPAQGFAAQGGGAAVLLTASHLGFPLSTTHSITGAVLGAGAAKNLSAVRWGLAGNIAVAWVLTLPAAAAVGAVTYGVSRIFGTGALGPLLISVSLIMLIAAMFGKRLRHGPRADAAAGGGRMIGARRLRRAARARLGGAARRADGRDRLGLVVYGTARAARRAATGAPARAALHAAVATIGGLLFVTAIVLGLIVTTAKG